MYCESTILPGSLCLYDSPPDFCGYMNICVGCSTKLIEQKAMIGYNYNLCPQKDKNEVKHCVPCLVALLKIWTAGMFE